MKSKYYRDPKSVNSHVYLPWDKVVSEPPTYKQMNWKCSWYFGLCSCNIQSPWIISALIFYRTTDSIYTRISLPFMLLISFISGLFFGALAFTHVWIIYPIRKLMFLNGILWRKLIQELLGEVVGSVALVWRFMLAGKQLKTSSVNTELAGVFLAKQHWAGGTEDHFRPGRLRDKSKPKYPKIKQNKMPFSGRKLKKVVARKIQFMTKALELAQAKLPSLEVLESAFRLAVVKREQRFYLGEKTIKKSLELARSRRRDNNEEEPEDADLALKHLKSEIKMTGNSLWVLAKNLALARLRRGKTNWLKAKRRLIRERKKKISFWFRAKNLVFSFGGKDAMGERLPVKKTL